MQKRKPLVTSLFSLATLLLILSSSSIAANYKRNSTPSPTKTTRTTSYASYKGETARATYKGEVPAKPISRPIMAPITLKEGPYLGIAGGYDSYKIHQATSFTGTTNATYEPTINATGLIGALLAGYGHYFNNALYLGFEVFLNTSEAYQSANYSISDSTDNISYNTKFFVSTGYGAKLLPGIKLSDSGLVYFQLAYQIARLRGQESLEDNGVIIPSNTSSWSGGFSYGLGFEEAMVENFSLRGEYIHTDYRSFSATSGTEYSPSNNQFLLSLIYHFV